MLILGVTGGIGSGKSTVARLMAAKSAKVIDADIIARDMLTPDSQSFTRVVNEFGQVILKKDGTLDRKKLAGIVFNDPLKLEILNRLLHPAVINSIKMAVGKYRKLLPDDVVIVIDAPLLVETELLSLVNVVIVVVASSEVRLGRLLKDGYSREDALARIKIQTPSNILLKYADYTIDNEKTLEELKEKVDELWQKIVKS